MDTRESSEQRAPTSRPARLPVSSGITWAKAVGGGLSVRLAVWRKEETHIQP